MSGAPENLPAPPEQQVKCHVCQRLRHETFQTHCDYCDYCNCNTSATRGLDPRIFPVSILSDRPGDSSPKVRVPPRNHQVATPPGYRRNLTSPLRTNLHPSRVFVNQKTQNIAIDTTINHNPLCLTQFRAPARHAQILVSEGESAYCQTVFASYCFGWGFSISGRFPGAPWGHSLPDTDFCDRFEPRRSFRPETGAGTRPIRRREAP
jgi:hypothetical protein